LLDDSSKKSDKIKIFKVDYFVTFRKLNKFLFKKYFYYIVKEKMVETCEELIIKLCPCKQFFIPNFTKKHKEIKIRTLLCIDLIKPD